MAARKRKQDSPEENDKENSAAPVVHKGVVERSITQEMRESYLDYAMSVITSRALPDVRDGLKPVHRRILFAMAQMNLSPNAKFRKSATVVGDVLGKYHPHGDASVYDAMTKLAQDFAMRYPLVKGQGNFGSVDGDPPAAMRYTEAKMERLAVELMRDLEKDTVLWRPNYDSTRKEPTVFPAAVPNILLNGTLGIAVGMATNIPPHNLRELIDATVHLIDNSEATSDDLAEFVKGPDFPTGGVVFNQKEIRHAYASGKGGIVTRGEAEINEDKKGNYQIVISSIPYRVNKATLLERIADLVREKKLEGIKELRDESTREIRVVVGIKSGAHPQNVLNYIYKHTELETVFHVNAVALVDGVPQTLSLKGILDEFIKHRKEVVRRRTEYDLAKARAREHILLGLSKALDHIDEIISIIKKSKNREDAKLNLMKRFRFSDLQAEAILVMQLQRLSGLERKKIEDELKAVQEFIKYCEDLLKSMKKMLGVIKDELKEIYEKYGDDRRTKVVRTGVKTMSMEDLVPDEEQVLVLSAGGYIKRTNPSEYRVQKRGGVGVVDLSTKEEDFVTMLVPASTHSSVLFFTNKGKAYQTKMYEVPEGKRATKGKSIMNFLAMSDGERITSIRALPKGKDRKEMSLFMVTRGGTAKKVVASSFEDVRRSGLISIKLDPGDELMGALLVGKGETVSLVTALGQSVRFKESEIREMGRQAAGVRAIKLGKGDSVVGSGIVSNEEKGVELLVLSENGFGKRSPIKEYKVQGRGGSGIKTSNVSKKTGPLIASWVLGDGEDEELVVISKKGVVIRTPLKDIPTLSRATQGVRIMKLRDGDAVASFICL